ncbi:hypothetical protein ILYODFUR_023529 [Ilyodon furcidens]|uniref:Uncharacterized protein n=1 Tax=Ilyodon furcidens TaxID=33524 RepID=A0ABV0V680_9TELE
MGTGVIGGWGRSGGQGQGLGFSCSVGTSLGCCWNGLPVSTPERRGPPPGSRAWLALWAISTWTWEYGVCMGSVIECMTSIVVCLYVGCVGVSVFRCVHEGGNV